MNASTKLHLPAAMLEATEPLTVYTISAAAVVRFVGSLDLDLYARELLHAHAAGSSFPRFRPAVLTELMPDNAQVMAVAGSLDVARIRERALQMLGKRHELMDRLGPGIDGDDPRQAAVWGYLVARSTNLAGPPGQVALSELGRVTNFSRTSLRELLGNFTYDGLMITDGESRAPRAPAVVTITPTGLGLFHSWMRFTFEHNVLPTTLPIPLSVLDNAHPAHFEAIRLSADCLWQQTALGPFRDTKLLDRINRRVLLRLLLGGDCPIPAGAFIEQCAAELRVSLQTIRSRIDHAGECHWLRHDQMLALLPEGRLWALRLLVWAAARGRAVSQVLLALEERMAQLGQGQG